ncbi:UDP-GalNAc:beta-1,3-N-acetylgalactosaminyltransferase 1 isoform X2 [Carettochelys insculpta]|uniref:UDP-GalNAc:beta-1, 3-N-acetylgalactosaminyltransferase 1 isoform X2 n=1 Tax=Carettochelys insculpta TaxID=44489 RepID=UPI003EC141C2
MPQGDYPDFPDLPGPSRRRRPPALEEAPGAGCPRVPADPYSTQTQDRLASPVLLPPDYLNDVVMDDWPEPPKADDPEETDLGGPLDQMDRDLPPTEGEIGGCPMLLHALPECWEYLRLNLSKQSTKLRKEEELEPLHSPSCHYQMQ